MNEPLDQDALEYGSMMPEQPKAVRSSELLCREIHAHIVSRAEWWRTNPDDSHGINKAVYVAMLEVANAINSALVFQELERHNNKVSDGGGL